jgi:hypothetical protein
VSGDRAPESPLDLRLHVPRTHPLGNLSENVDDGVTNGPEGPAAIRPTAGTAALQVFPWAGGREKMEKFREVVV